MNVMLIYPPVSVEERYARGVGKGVGGDLPPLGIASLAAFIRERGYSVDAVDSVGLNLTVEDLLRRIDEARPAVVGFSALTVNFHRALACAEQIRSRFPHILTLLGGHHATITPREVLSTDNFFDILCLGEGELTLLEVLDRFRDGGADRARFLADEALLRSIKGIAFRDAQGKPALSPPRELIKDLDILPHPARDLLPMDRYIPLPNQYLRLPVVHMTAIRGCPFACTFCSNNAVFGRRIRAKSPAKTVDEIAFLKATYGAREISFWDDTMTTQRDWMMGFCDELIARKLEITWTGYSRVDTVDLEMLKRMKQAGCWNLFYGYEAGDQGLLDIIAKGTTLDQIRQANRWTKEAGIEVRGSFMIALPGETPELALKTIAFAKELCPDYAQFSITTPYPGTKLWDDAQRYGELDLDYRKYHGWLPVFLPHGYKDKEQILAMGKRAMREFYLRPQFIWQSLRKIRTVEDVKRYAKGLRFLLGWV